MALWCDIGKHGQGSLEIILIVAIILTIAVYIMSFYSQESRDTISTAIARMDADLCAQNMRFQGYYAYVYNVSSSGTSIRVEISNCPHECQKLIGACMQSVDTSIKNVTNMTYSVSLSYS